MVEISVSLCGVRLKNPFVLAAGPYGRDSGTLARAVKAGFGAVTTKTISRLAAKNSFPNIAMIGKETLINSEKWSDLPPRAWVEQEIGKVKRLGVPVIASVGLTAGDVKKIAPLVENSGATMVEIVSYNSSELLPMLRAAKSVVGIPVIAKMSANWGDLLRIAVKVEKCGSDAVSAIDSIGPVQSIDVETGRPRLSSVWGEGWLSGAAIHPLAVRSVARIANSVKIPVIGIGGVFTGKDAAEMIMAGACCVGLCTAPLVYGLQVVERIERQLVEFIDRKGYKSLKDFRAKTLKQIRDGKELKQNVHPQIDVERCTLCRLCVNLCPYQALGLSGKKLVSDRNRCLSCGLCCSICPSHAITLSRD